MGSIRVTQLGKAYKQYPKRWSRLAEWLLPSCGVQHQLKWVLKGIDFQIAPGEAVGIIGINGAGKSTLLKLITGTTNLSAGSIYTHGRIAALLELGIGFNPELTGRQNVQASGQLQGLNRHEITALMPSIESFAHIGNAIDEPVRQYSSGMQMRLAFSVATCVRPDILVVDEALAVGDVFFQQKCFDRIRDFVAAGTTLLFVSHSLGTVLTICSRCLFIRQGELAFDGASKEAIDLFQADLLLGNAATPGRVAFPVEVNKPRPAEVHDGFMPAELRTATAISGRTGSIETPGAECLAVKFTTMDGIPVGVISAEQAVKLQIAFRSHISCDDPHVGFKIRNRLGVVMFETNSYCMKQQLGALKAHSVLVAEFSFLMNLFPDEYTVTVGLSNSGYAEGSFADILSYLHEVIVFTVTPNPGAITWAGVVNLNPQLSHSQISFSDFPTQPAVARA